ncbi:MAG: signal peptide peptidase SppA [Paludibacteraceae bacterium]|nr:signal peptide peptidase SppA [Paludibacteraceae bacterium]
MQTATNNNGQQQRRGGCLRGCLIGLAIYFGLSFLFGLMFGSMFSSSTVKLEDYSVYKLELSGNLVEQGQEANPFADMLGNMPGYNQAQTSGLDQILDNIRLAEQDEKIKGIYLYGGSMNMAPASAKAIRDRLLLFKQRSGKWIIAYSDNYSCTNYYVASVADKMYINPTANISWRGLTAQKMYFTRLMEKIGVEMQIMKVGTFKSAVEPLFRTSMSEADKQQTMLYLQGIWDEYRAAVSASRGISETDLDRYADEHMGLQQAEKYIAYNLADTLIYREEMDEVLRVMSGSKDYKLMSTAKLAQVERPKAKSKNRIAVLYAEGNIQADAANDGITAKETIKQIKAITKDDEVKAVVFRVNSPGGSADASEEIWHGVKTLQAKGLPVVVSMGDYAASGGYYISCAADYIYAEPTTLTGSIGIFGTVPNIKKLREKIGLDVDGISTHKHAGMDVTMVYSGMNSEEFAMMQTMIENGYDLFTRRCADGRKMTQDDIKKIAEGRVWLGKDAIGIGLVDSLGNIDDAIVKAAELAGIESYDINYYPKPTDPLEEMLKMISGEQSEEEKLIARIRLLAKEPRVLMVMEPVEIK